MQQCDEGLTVRLVFAWDRKKTPPAEAERLANACLRDTPVTDEHDQQWRVRSYTRTTGYVQGSCSAEFRLDLVVPEPGHTHD